MEIRREVRHPYSGIGRAADLWAGSEARNPEPASFFTDRRQGHAVVTAAGCELSRSGRSPDAGRGLCRRSVAPGELGCGRMPVPDCVHPAGPDGTWHSKGIRVNGRSGVKQIPETSIKTSGAAGLLAAQSGLRHRVFPSRGPVQFGPRFRLHVRIAARHRKDGDAGGVSARLPAGGPTGRGDSALPDRSGIRGFRVRSSRSRRVAC